MKRSPMPRRRAPLARGASELRRSGPLRAGGPVPAAGAPAAGSGARRARSGQMRAVSAGASRARADRARVCAELAVEGVGCEIGPVLRAAGLDGLAAGCSGRLEGLHERRKRSAAGSLVDPRNLIPACNWCNGVVEDEAGVVREVLGDVLVVREGDREWVELGRRAGVPGRVVAHPCRCGGAWVRLVGGVTPCCGRVPEDPESAVGRAGKAPEARAWHRWSWADPRRQAHLWVR